MSNCSLPKAVRDGILTLGRSRTQSAPVSVDTAPVIAAAGLVLVEIFFLMVIRGYRLYAFLPDAQLMMAVVRLDLSLLVVWCAFVRLNLLLVVVLWLAYRRSRRLTTTVQGLLVALLLVSCSLAVQQPTSDAGESPPKVTRRLTLQSSGRRPAELRSTGVE